MYEVLVNRLGGLSLSRRIVVRLTDHPHMTIAIYRGRKTIVVRLTDRPHMTIAVYRGRITITQQLAEVRHRYYFIGGGSRAV